MSTTTAPEDSSHTPQRGGVVVSAVVFVSAVLLLAGAGIAMLYPQLLGDSSDRMTATTRVYADYVVSRDLALATSLVTFWCIRALRSLGAILLVTALVQLFDLVLDVTQQRFEVVPVVAVIGIGCAIASGRISSWSAFQPRTWKIR